MVCVVTETTVYLYYTHTHSTVGNGRRLTACLCSSSFKTPGRQTDGQAGKGGGDEETSGEKEIGEEEKWMSESDGQS